MSNNRKREEKISTGYTVKAEAETGILKAYVSIFGIEDDSWFNDIIEPGAFKKTIAERGPGGSNKIRVLWMHSMREVIGKVLRLEEHSRDMLPDYVRDRYPYASGGLYAETQLVLGVQRGREAFELYKAEAMDEWSIGFDPIEERFEERDKRTIRILKEIRLWEYSPVTWGANPATTTVEVRGNMLAMLNEIKAEHPEYDDYQLLQAAEQRLAPVSPEPVIKEKTQVPVGIDLTSKASFLLEETSALFETLKAEHPEYDDLQLIKAVEERLSPKQVIEPEPMVEVEAILAQPELIAPPLVDSDNWKWAASRRIKLRELELSLTRGHHVEQRKNRTAL